MYFTPPPKTNTNMNRNDHELDIVFACCWWSPGSSSEWQPSGAEAFGWWRRAGRSWVERLAVGMDGHSWVSDPGSVHMFGAYPHICSAETSFAPRPEPQQ